MIGKYIKVFDNHSEYEDYITGSSKVLPNISYCKDDNDVHYNAYYQPLVVVYNVTDISEPTYLISKHEDQVSEMVVDGAKLDNVSTYYQFNSVGEHTVEYTFVNPKVIPEEMFWEIYIITSVSIPKHVVKIGAGAFLACELTGSINISKNLTEIGDWAFSNADFTSITVDAENPVYDSRNNCNAIIETASNKLIKGCKNTVFPTDIVEIGDSAFTSITLNFDPIIPEGVIKIGSDAFYNTKQAAVVIIPSTVTFIGDNAFEDCNVYQEIALLAVTPPELGGNSVFDGTNVPIRVPSESVEAYKAANRWSEYANRIDVLD